MVTVTYGARVGSVDVHRVSQILIKDTGTLGDDVLVLHVHVIIDGEKVLVVPLHVLHVDEIALGAADPLDALDILNDLSIGVSGQAVKEAHLEVVPQRVYDFLDLVVQPVIGHDHVVLEHHCVLESLFEALPVKLHVAHVAPDGPHVEVGYVGSKVFSVVVHS